MSEALKIVCPCCDTLIVVDPVYWSAILAPPAPPQTLFFSMN